MSKFRSSRFRQTIGALAIWGALLNACVLANHITSVALASLHASGDSIVICHLGGIKFVGDSESSLPSSKKRCPICSGFATLHLGVVTGAPDASFVSTIVSDTVHADEGDALAVGYALHRISNRGPPRVV